MITREFHIDGNPFDIQVDHSQDDTVRFRVNGNDPETATVVRIDDHTLAIDHGGRLHTVHLAENDTHIFVHVAGRIHPIEKEREGDGRGGSGESGGSDQISAPMPGRILQMFVGEGEAVEKGQRLFIVEAMKMENEVRAPRAGAVQAVNFGEGDLVAVGQPVVELAPDTGGDDGDGK